MRHVHFLATPACSISGRHPQAVRAFTECSASCSLQHGHLSILVCFISCGLQCVWLFNPTWDMCRCCWSGLPGNRLMLEVIIASNFIFIICYVKGDSKCHVPWYYVDQRVVLLQIAIIGIPSANSIQLFPSSKKIPLSVNFSACTKTSTPGTKPS